jgi:hypothetical protein
MLLDLPVELLVAIALQVPQARNADLCNLALVCRKLRYVAQEALVKPVNVSVNNPSFTISGLLNTLIHREDLAKRLHHVDLGDYAAGDRPGETDSVATNYQGLVTKKYGADFWTELVRMREGDPWGPRRSFFLALLLVVADNFCSLAFQMRPLASPSQFLVSLPHSMLLTLQEFDPPFNDTVMSLLGEKITTLSIADNAPSRTPYMHNLDLTALHSLKCLSLPIDALVRRNVISIHPSLVLPASIRRLQVRSCNRFLLELLQNLSKYEHYCPALKTLDLYFHGSLISAILVASHGEEARMRSFNTVLQGLALKEVEMTIHTTDSSQSPDQDTYGLASCLSESTALSLLSLEEIAMAAASRVNFSVIVARDQTGAPRARSAFEVRLLTRCRGMPLALFTSPTFNAASWSGVRLFNGRKHTRADPAFKQAKPATTISKEEAHKGRAQKKIGIPIGALPCFSKETPVPALGLSESKALGAAVWPPVINHIPLPTLLLSESSTFEAAAWHECNFSEAFKVVQKNPRRQLGGRTQVPIRRKMPAPAGEKVDEVVSLVAQWKF